MFALDVQVLLSALLFVRQVGMQVGEQAFIEPQLRQLVHVTNKSKPPDLTSQSYFSY